MGGRPTKGRESIEMKKGTKKSLQTCKITEALFNLQFSNFNLKSVI
jgi:hypothetical protein